MRSTAFHYYHKEPIREGTETRRGSRGREKGKRKTEKKGKKERKRERKAKGKKKRFLASRTIGSNSLEALNLKVGLLIPMTKQ